MVDAVSDVLEFVCILFSEECMKSLLIEELCMNLRNTVGTFRE